MPWELIKHSSNDEGIELIFELRDSAKTREIWPYGFMTTLKMHLGHDIRISLRINAQMQSTAALHTYLTCKNIFDVKVEGLGAHYNDSLAGGAVCESYEKALHVSQAVDRIYTQANEVTHLNEHARTLSIVHQNHSDVVVWNPWKEGVMQLADMKEEDYTKMLCIETARISKPLAYDDSLHVRIF
jgi:glucose-6-phosphate 1-epimerase